MDRGWGLTLDNSADQVGFFGSKAVFGVNSSPRLDRRSGGVIMFPRGREESSPPENRAVLGEVDFFAEKKKVVKKEDSRAEASASRDLDVNVSKLS